MMQELTRRARRGRGHVRDNAVAYAALFVALSGTSYAATSLPAHSVGTRQLKTGAVTRSRLHANAVDSAKVRNHTLRRQDFAAGQIPRGPTGPAGTARAYGLVARDGALVSARSKNVESVTKPAGTEGVYCISLSGVDATNTEPVVSIDYHNAVSTQSDLAAVAQIWSANSKCPAGTLTVITRQIQQGSASGTPSPAPSKDENFFFAVP
jgi:hypothetical protein